MAEESPTQISNDDLLENGLILVQQLYADSLVNDQERDHLKGKDRDCAADYASTFLAKLAVIHLRSEVSALR